MLRFILVGLSLILLNACDFRTAKDFAQEKATYAERIDNITLCKIFVQEESFIAHQNICKQFFNENERCRVFPEKQYGCNTFLNSDDYAHKKVTCGTFRQRAKRCRNTQIKEQPLFSFDISKHPWLKKIADFYEINYEKELWFETIKKQSDENPELLIGVIISGYQKEAFLRGLNLAIKELNNQGGILNRKLRIFVVEDEGSIDKSRDFAKKIQQNEKIGIVIGRQYSSTTIPVTFVYENSKILYLSASATNQRVIRYGMQSIFRLLPNNASFAENLSKFSKNQNYKKMVLLNSRDDYNDELSQAFYDYGIKNGIDFIYQKSFFANKTDFSDIISELKKQEFDAIFIATGVKTALKIIKQARKMQIDSPFLGTDGLDSDVFVKKLGADGNNIIIPSIYDVNSTEARNVHFVTLFQKEYGIYPETWSAQGYDAIHLLANAINHVHSTVPEQIAAALRYQVSMMGATGLYQFLTTGELVEQNFYFKKLQQGEFEIIDKRLTFQQEKTPLEM